MPNIHENTKTGDHSTRRTLKLLVYLTIDNQLFCLYRQDEP